MKLPLKETLITGTCLAILLGLGTWQVKRLEWKNAIIERLENAYAQGASAPVLSESSLAALSHEDDPMSYGRVEGRLERDKAILLGPRTLDGRFGYHLLIPLETSDGHELIVNTGWVADQWQDDLEERLAVLPVDPVTVRGVIRKPDWSSFASKNSPASDIWFRADIGEIAKAKQIEKPYPFILYAVSSSPALVDVTPHESGWLPRNKHLQYALFWYAMGIVLLGVYGFYVADRNKKKAP